MIETAKNRPPPVREAEPRQGQPRGVEEGESASPKSPDSLRRLLAPGRNSNGELSSFDTAPNAAGKVDIVRNWMTRSSPIAASSNMFLLMDGRLLVQDMGSDIKTTAWWILTPDAKGSYREGT